MEKRLEEMEQTLKALSEENEEQMKVLMSVVDFIQSQKKFNDNVTKLLQNNGAIPPAYDVTRYDAEISKEEK